MKNKNFFTEKNIIFFEFANNPEQQSANKEISPSEQLDQIVVNALKSAGVQNADDPKVRDAFYQYLAQQDPSLQNKEEARQSLVARLNAGAEFMIQNSAQEFARLNENDKKELIDSLPAYQYSHNETSKKLMEGDILNPKQRQILQTYLSKGYPDGQIRLLLSRGSDPDSKVLFQIFSEHAKRVEGPKPVERTRGFN